MSVNEYAEDEREFVQCPHEVIRATCAGVCMCACEPCAPSRPTKEQA